MGSLIKSLELGRTSSSSSVAIDPSVARPVSVLAPYLTVGHLFPSSCNAWWL